MQEVAMQFRRNANMGRLGLSAFVTMTSAAAMAQGTPQPAPITQEQAHAIGVDAYV